MTGTDLIVLAPWIAFGAGLAVICLVLLRSHRTSRPRPRRSSRPVQGATANRVRAGCPDPQETRCPEKNAQARPR
jgi:hypothetical protein